ncbi:MAG TPA: pyruvate:ferredoxin (flavodoxin) oxidoreductase [Anaerolineales bacterium]|nr:pyruvate:ferredoxin (flavodoxin) oxidoreductase [Anaerolineales bacterium]
MTQRPRATIDANEAVARIAHKLNEVIAIYPITPSTPMGEFSDQWSAEGQANLWGVVPSVMEMQSEAGAAGAVHGALQAGSLTTTFTASQGLMLMLPNMHKIAGELTSAVFHVAARSLAAQGLSIFGDHSDVMAARNTGWAMLASNSVQEAHDFAAISQAVTLITRVPILHFFDGFRTSHEINKIELLTDADLHTLVTDELVAAHRARALSPERPFIRGTAQNPDVYFQGRETVNPYYTAFSSVLSKVLAQFAALTGRNYLPYEYVGAPDAERVLVLMGSGAETVEETVRVLWQQQGEKVGVLKVRMYRPLVGELLVQALPTTVQKIAVLDRCKEPGSAGEPLYLDVIAAIHENWQGALPRVIGGRYGLSSKEFTPAMVKAIFEQLTLPRPKQHFTIGIVDDVSHTSLDYDASYSIESADAVKAIFFGLGSDGTVGANKNSIKIIGDETELYPQGYFVYDSKKSGSMTVSYLRFGPQPIRAPYLISQANFLACHQFQFLQRINMVRYLAEGGTFLLNSPYPPESVWAHLPSSTQSAILEKKLKLYVIDAVKVARETGMGSRINTIMQVCFFAISNILPRTEAIAAIKNAIYKTYAKRGDVVVQKNYAAVDAALDHLHIVPLPSSANSNFDLLPPVSPNAPAFVQSVTAAMIAGDGDLLPVSALPVDGTYPSGTTAYEKRNIAEEIPVWDPAVCIQCGKCVYVCPHAVIREKVYDKTLLANAPSTFKTTDARFKEFREMGYTLQVAPEDCTGCTLCVEACPAKNKSDASRKAINMAPQRPLRETEAENWDFFLGLPELDRTSIAHNSVKYSQLLQPLFEFSGACAGCGETPYLKLISQLFGDRALIANATGCSSIYGGNLPTTPWAHNADGRGPAWANSLFEDNAEFGLGMRLALDHQKETAQHLLRQMGADLGDELVNALLQNAQSSESEIQQQRVYVAQLKERLAELKSQQARLLETVVDGLVQRSVWIVGGDGWAYDIGYSGLDHVLAGDRNVNILVMDTEVYSNTGGQMSKATPRGAVAKFAAAGKQTGKKDLGLLAISYGHVYVARVAFGANDEQTVKAIAEAEAYDGPSLVIAYSHCIAHGYDLKYGLKQQKLASQSGYWPLYRYNPDLRLQGKASFSLDSKAPSIPLQEYMYNEGRFNILVRTHPQEAQKLLSQAQAEVKSRWAEYERLAVELGDKKAA